MSKRAVFALSVGLFVFWFIRSSRADYREYERDLEGWHRRCDAYVNKPAAADPRTADCQREFDELLAYAKRKGWAP